MFLRTFVEMVWMKLNEDEDWREYKYEYEYEYEYDECSAQCCVVHGNAGQEILFKGCVEDLKGGGNQERPNYTIWSRTYIACYRL